MHIFPAHPLRGMETSPFSPYAPAVSRGKRPPCPAQGPPQYVGRSKATRPPMFQLTLERGLFRFELNTPALDPLFQLPPR